MGPISTGLGEIYQYTVEAPGNDLVEARTIQDWLIKPVLRTVPGVAEVNSFGGLEKQYQVLIRPDALLKFGLNLRQVQQAIAANNLNRGGGYIVKNAEQFVVRGVGQVQTIEQIKNIVIASSGGVPVRVQDLAEVKIDSAPRQGAITKDGKGEAVTGIVMMLLGSNSRVVVEDVKSRIVLIVKTLPKGISLKPFYDRADLVNRTIHTVEKNLFEGAVLVIVVLLLLLENIRAALIVALAIPLSMLFAVTLMVKFGIAGSLMSLGAIDFGLIVDGSVVMVENSVRRLSERQNDQDLFTSIVAGCAEVGRPIIFGVGIIIIVYLPILTLEGVEGRLFRPMALTVIFALIGSLILTFTLTPVLTSLFIGKVKEKHVGWLQKVARAYEHRLEWVFERKRLVLYASALLLMITVFVSLFLGSEFIPTLDENAFALEMRRPPGISLTEANRQNTLLEQYLLKLYPAEIETIVSKTGRGDVAMDPMGPNSTDFIILLKPREQWRKVHSRETLIGTLEADLSHFMGVSYEFSQPIEMRMNELIAGVRSDIAIRIFGEDMKVLDTTAGKIVATVSKLNGARGFRAQQVAGLPMIEVVVLPDKLARYGINSGDVMEVIEAIAGLDTTQIIEGQRRFDLVLKFAAGVTNDKEAISRLLVSAPGGEMVPLGQLANIRELEGPAEISHLGGSRMMAVEGNVRGRDIGSFIADARRLFDEKKIALPVGYRVEFGGQFQNLERARKRLLIVVPLSLFLIFLLLFTTFNSIRQALLVFSGIPLAAVGGVTVSATWAVVSAWPWLCRTRR